VQKCFYEPYVIILLPHRGQGSSHKAWLILETLMKHTSIKIQNSGNHFLVIYLNYYIGCEQNASTKTLDLEIGVHV